jgi:hypothetical protein
MGIKMRVHSSERVAADDEAREIVRIELENGMVQEYGRTFQAVFYRGEGYNVSKYVLQRF